MRHAGGTADTAACAGATPRAPTPQLLGQASDDIDIALDDQTGAQFVETVNAVLQESGQAASSVGIIKRNPEQSKVRPAPRGTRGRRRPGLTLRSLGGGCNTPATASGDGDDDAARPVD